MNEETKKIDEAYEFLLELLKNRHIFVMDASDAANNGEDEFLQEKLTSEMEKSAAHLANLDDLVSWLKKIKS